ncbi:peptide ABC transporter substrate-binding protein [Lactobacillus sp. LC28-10]|uniref:Peptide ABC transporter substrate-binding protein n=1 Tax=Secundilactobacillus angelensis TaxID=2722706 RepID=A0ABX1KYL1_9LACO|nr:peptide ABC transporter substrate-binding protein [Secundilactobacillus angelensis]MCH5462293.1 peptide ABC transporter substrate-binding protein [Secundilactobacillus angelensis]NLR19032.1 peptide ABC transporter substrate-binding protein [Secundilactobacillus angelensis]
MKFNKALALGAVSGVSVLLLAACGSKSSNKSLATDQTLNWVETSNLPTMDPSKSTDIVSATALNNVDEGLLRIGQGSKLRPGVAKNYKVSKDGKTWTFNLRHSKWSNGDPVTAKDFVYGWQRTVKPKTASQYAYLYDHVKNFSAVNKGKMAPSKLGIKADGDYKVVVTLSRPQSYFKYIVGAPAFFPQNQKVVEKYGSKFAANSKQAVYNGPFTMTGWNGTNNTWTLAKNKNYWDAKATKLKAVKFQVIKDQGTWLSQYQSGKVDELITDGTQYKQFKNSKQMHVRNSASTFYLEMNQRKGFFKNNLNARKAVNMAINNGQLTKDILADGSQTPKGLVPTNLAKKGNKDFADAAYVKSGTEYNLAQAKTYWKKALKQSGKSSMTLNLLSDDTPAGKKTAEFLQSQLNKLPGLKVTTSNVPFNVRLSRSTKGQFDMVVSGWIADFPDAISFSSLFTSNNAYNRGQWKNSSYDTDVKNAEGKDANNTNARWNDLVNAEKTIMQQQGVVPLYQQTQSQMLKSKVHGVQYFPTGAQWDFSHAYLSK